MFLKSFHLVMTVNRSGIFYMPDKKYPAGYWQPEANNIGSHPKGFTLVRRLGSNGCLLKLNKPLRPVQSGAFNLHSINT